MQRPRSTRDPLRPMPTLTRPSEPKKLGQQLKYADRRGHRVAVIAGENEFAAGTVQLKDLRAARQQDVPLDSVAEALTRIMRDDVGW